MQTATAIANPNIAFIKYWGNRDNKLRIPANSSISMNLDNLITKTQVTFSPDFGRDSCLLNGEPLIGEPYNRVSSFLDIVRQMAGISWAAQVESQNNFPTGTGIASSASAFASLSLAASQAAGLKLTEQQLSRLARRGSGSACRSVPGGFVEWPAGEDDESSFAFSIAPPEHWALTDCIAIVSRIHKRTGSFKGQDTAHTSLLQRVRVEDAPRRMDLCRKAILSRDFEAFAEIVELDCNLMHAVMMTSSPAIIYWEPATLEIIQAVQVWRNNGLAVCYTIDAGPNVHVICLSPHAKQISSSLVEIPGVEAVLSANPGGPVSLLDYSSEY
jgi:diphosphomevalonate decarboxylase